MAERDPYSRFFSFFGADSMSRRLTRLRTIAPRLAGQALFEEATTIFNRSQRLVPVRTGVLKASGYVTPPEFIGPSVRVTIGYGGAAAPYATIVHERIYRTNKEGDLVQVRHKSPSAAKFLETPMVDAEPRFEYRLGQRVGRILMDEGAI